MIQARSDLAWLFFEVAPRRNTLGKSGADQAQLLADRIWAEAVTTRRVAVAYCSEERAIARLVAEQEQRRG